MKPLRQRMIQDMKLKNLAPGTQVHYIHHVEGLAKYYMINPAELDIEDIRNYLLYLLEERKLSAEAVNQCVSDGCTTPV